MTTPAGKNSDNPGRPAKSDASSLKPRDAATLIVVDRSGPPRILMGRRRPSQVFLPDKFVFPGGRADRIDRIITAAGDLGESCLRKLLIDMKGGAASPQRARGLALAALRETYEEAGLLIGQPGRPPCGSDTPAQSDQGAWAGFLGEDITPALTPLTFLARAITPPGRPRRYDTRFFLVDAAHIAKTVPPPDDELRDLGWFTIEELRRLDVPNITRAVIEDVNEYLGAKGRGDADWPVPFYYFRAGTFERVLLRS
ncbi:MAG: NUDIX hydrolase [Alphaproteobacteria bacterium]|nr:NUDIX hydrolase [Alphaproteobacteria bacterium]